MRKSVVVVAAALLALAVGEAPRAQQGPGMPMQNWPNQGPGWMGPGMQGGGPGMMMMGPGMMGSWVENQLAAMRTDLQLTEAQKPAFDEFAKAMRDSTTAMMSGMMMGPGMMMGWQGNALQMMEQMQQRMQARLDAMKQVQSAANKLYEQLESQQRAVFDRYAMMGMM